MRGQLTIIVAGFWLALPLHAAEMTASEQAVWQLEEDYWRFVSSGEVEAYVRLWHDDFVGWPCFELNPTGKQNIGGWVRDIRDKNWKLTYRLKPMAVQEFGEKVVVVHYAAEYVYDYGDGTSSGGGLWRKFTHTWKKSGDRWQIIGGMCAAQEPVKAPRTQNAQQSDENPGAVGSNPSLLEHTPPTAQHAQ